ncbi:unnamed protein product [Ixodes persulcatus]
MWLKAVLKTLDLKVKYFGCNLFFKRKKGMSIYLSQPASFAESAFQNFSSKLKKKKEIDAFEFLHIYCTQILYNLKKGACFFNWWVI